MARQLFISSTDPGIGNFHYYNLPKGLIEITLEDNGSYSFKVEKKIVPDPDHRYFLQYTNTGRSNDKVNIKFNEEGYLSYVNIDSEDAALKVIEKVVESIKEAVLPGTRGIGDAPNILIKETFDPFNEKEVAAVVAKFQRIKGLETFFIDFKSLAKKKMKAKTADSQYGILCKPMELCEFRYGIRGDAEKNESDSDTQMLLQLPHPDVTHLISVPNAPFVKSVLTIQFNEYGYPNDINIDQPSWWLEVAGMPSKILKGLFALPSQLIQLRVNYMNDTTDAKKELAKARERIEKQEQLLAAKAEALKEGGAEEENA